MKIQHLLGIALMTIFVFSACTLNPGLQGRAVGQTAAEATRITEFDTILSVEQVELLTGSEWVLESMGPGNNRTPIHSEQAITANFEAEDDDLTSGMVSGSSGCNTYEGSYATDGKAIFISDLAVAERACDETVMNQETAFLSALLEAHSFTIDSAPQLIMLVGSEDDNLAFDPQ